MSPPRKALRQTRFKNERLDPFGAELMSLAELRGRLEDVTQLDKLGKYSEAEELLKEIAPGVASLAFPPLQAEVAYYTARILRFLGKYAEAEPALKEAIQLALQWRMMDLAARASNEEVFLVGYLLRRHAEIGRHGLFQAVVVNRIGYPTTLVDANYVAGGPDGFNVLFMPSVQGAALDRLLGDNGRAALGTWVRNGGVLITIDGATNWVAQESTRLARIRVRRDSTRADSTGGAPLPAGLPGVFARATIDTLPPLLAGVTDLEIPVFATGDRVLTVPKDLSAREAVVRYAAKDRVRLAGYFWPEMPERIALSPWLWTERVGRGRVIAFASDPNMRALLRGMVPVFGNAVLMGGY